MEDNLRVIISGGGTGGHIFPALSIDDAVKYYLSVQRTVWKCNVFPQRAIPLRDFPSVVSIDVIS